MRLRIQHVLGFVVVVGIFVLFSDSLKLSERKQVVPEDHLQVQTQEGKRKTEEKIKEFNFEDEDRNFRIISEDKFIRKPDLGSPDKRKNNHEENQNPIKKQSTITEEEDVQIDAKSTKKIEKISTDTSNGNADDQETENDLIDDLKQEEQEEEAEMLLESTITEGLDEIFEPKDEIAEEESFEEMNGKTITLKDLQNKNKPLDLGHLVKLLRPGEKMEKCEDSTSYRGFSTTHSVCGKCSELHCPEFSFITFYTSRIPSAIVLMKNVGIHPNLIHCSKGGENITDVLHRAESAEMPKYDAGAFQIFDNDSTCKDSLARTWSRNNGEYQTNIVNSVQFNAHSAEIQICDATNHGNGIYRRSYINTPVFAITRYEYVNVWHTVTDFYNTFIALRFAGAIEFDAKHDTWIIHDHQILWLDGHSWGNLDDFWSVLFGSKVISRISDWKSEDKQDCMAVVDNLWLIPAGYQCPLMKFSLASCGHQVGAFDEFIHFIRDRVDAPPMVERKVILSVRHDYRAHPRNPSGRISRKIINEKELIEKIKEIPCISGLAIDLSTLSFEEQVPLICSAHVFVGVHGAGLTHVTWMDKKATLIEIEPSVPQPHFRLAAEFAGVNYVSIPSRRPVNDDYEVNVGAIVQAITKIVSPFPCKDTKAHFKSVH